MQKMWTAEPLTPNASLITVHTLSPSPLLLRVTHLSSF